MDKTKLSRDYEKEPIKKGEAPNNEDLRYLYIECNLSSLEVSNFFHKSDVQIKRYLTRYNIHKTKEQKIASRERLTLLKYGVKNVSQLKSVKTKKEQASLEKFGTKNPFAAETVKSKIKKTNLKRYGAENPGQAAIVQKKMKETNLEKYGCECVLSNSEIQRKIAETMLEKYDRTNPKQKHVSKETLEILSSKEKFKEYIDKAEFKTIPYIAKELGFSATGIGKALHKYNLFNLIDIYTSSYEIELQKLFPDMFIKTRKVIPPYEIDLYNEDLKFGIEFNGNYWHREKEVGIDYHQKKSHLAKEHGVFLYHIFEYEWTDPKCKKKIIAQLQNLLGLNEYKTFARKCDIREVPSKDSQAFLEENHLQGKDASSVKLGLYYQGELVSLMTFCKSRFDKKYDWELSRYCSKQGWNVVGGSSRLFKHFCSKAIGTILSYSNIAKTKGSMYRNLGFIENHTTNPGYVWWNGEQYFSRYQCQKHKLLKQGFEGRTEKEIMENLGYERIFDCGNICWTKTI